MKSGGLELVYLATTMKKTFRHKAYISCEDAFTITGRGTVICGRIQDNSTSVANNDIVIIGNSFVKIIGIEMFRKLMDKVIPGDNVGILIGTQMSKDEVLKYRRTLLPITNIEDMRAQKLDYLL